MASRRSPSSKWVTAWALVLEKTGQKPNEIETNFINIVNTDTLFQFIRL